MRDKFLIDIVLAIYTWYKNDDNFLEPKCGFLRGSDDKLYLPSQGLTNNLHASEVIIDIVKKLIKKNITEIDIVPLDFLDPINEEKRTITLSYKVMLKPSMPVYTNIEFLNYKELRENVVAKRRDITIFRRGLNS